MSFSAHADEPVYVCDDKEPWPPYTYPSSEEKAGAADRRIGAMVDFLDAVMREANISYEIKLKPWLRCLKEISSYSQSPQAEVMMGVNYNEERGQYALFSVPVFENKRGIFYSKSEFPDGPNWKTPSDTKNFVVCVVKGFDYSNVILSKEGPKFEVSSTKLALKQIKRGRCQVLFNSVAAVLGTKLYGDSIVPEGIAYKEYMTTKPNSYHIMVSKKSPRAELLLRKINRAIVTLNRNGTRQAIFTKYYDLMNR